MRTLDLSTLHETDRQFFVERYAGQSVTLDGNDFGKTADGVLLTASEVAGIAAHNGMPQGAAETFRVPTAEEQAELTQRHQAQKAERATLAEIEKQGGNPWQKGRGYNVTRQIGITKENPEIADRLRREAAAR